MLCFLSISGLQKHKKDSTKEADLSVANLSAINCFLRDPELAPALFTKEASGLQERHGLDVHHFPNTT